MDDQNGQMRASQEPFTSHLLRLPIELLEAIFRLAYEGGLVVGLCRALAPLQRRVLYRKVEVREYESLELLPRTLEDSNEIALVIEDLAAERAWGRTRRLAATRFVDGLCRLSNLRSLHLQRLKDPYLGSFLSSVLPAFSLPKLTHLRLHIARDPRAPYNPLDERHLRHLSLFPSLATLRIEAPASVAALPYTSQRPPPLARLKTLSLASGRLVFWALPPHFGESFPNLKALQLRDNTTDALLLTLFGLFADTSPRPFLSSVVFDHVRCEYGKRLQDCDWAFSDGAEDRLH
ncbi:hypothetical protein JCM10213v2_007278 [Rhodosporidiobolus nylandii]